MNDEQMRPLLKAWFHARKAAPTDVPDGVARVMARVPETRQRGRWWSLPAFHRKIPTPTATDTTDYRPDSIPATNGHAPTVIGRTRTMFSPVKAITVGALVLALGGVLLIAQPFDQGGGVPGAEQGAETSAATSFTGTIQRGDRISGGTWTDTDDGMAQATGIVRLARWEASDPRMTGDVTYTGNWLEIEDFEVQSGTYELTNDEGSWLGEATALVASVPGIEVDMDTIIFTGRDAYDGFTAYVLADWSDKGAPAEFMGVIFPGPMPEVPEPYVVE